MYEWRYQSGQPAPAFLLAADARLTTTDYLNDQIWELVPRRSEPPGVTVQTTYGLRARAMRIFPRFGVKGDLESDPERFTEPLVVRQYGPAWIQCQFAPLEGIRVTYDCFVIDAHALSGRFTLRNTSDSEKTFRMELAAVLSPAEGGERMHVVEADRTHVLSGATGNLVPVIFTTGGSRPGSGAFAGLEQTVELQPEETRTVHWVCAALGSQQESFDLARRLAGWQSDEFLARVEVLDSGMLQIRTGNRTWNQALNRALIAAYAMLHSPTSHLPHISFVQARQPDYGYSLRGDGSDYGPLWNGQPLLQSLYLAKFLLPANPEIAQGILENFLAVPGESGLDWKPGLGGQRGRYLASPLIASLAWEIYQATENQSMLEKIFPALLENYQAWFSLEQDRDGDGVPEWANPMQMGMDDHPAFSHWLDSAPGLDITTLESPDLLTFLYREGEILRRMAIQLDRKNDLKFIQPRLKALKKAVLECWDTDLKIFNPRDRDTHHIQRGEILGKRQGPGSVRIERKFRQPVRLSITVITGEGQIRRAEAAIRGTPAGFSPQKASKNSTAEEVFPPQRFRWLPGRGQTTSQGIFSSVEEVVVEHIAPEDEVQVQVTSHILDDISGLLPLWGAIPGEKQASEMAGLTLTDEKRFGRPFGIPTSALAGIDSNDTAHNSVSLPWNMLVIEGLLSYGLHQEAANLMTRIMEACAGVMEREGSFRRYYHAVTGSGHGERGVLEGIPAPGLFLEVLGVRILSPRRVRLSGENPFPWPVTVRYRGLTVMRQKEKTTVIFPDGQTTTVSGEGDYEVSL